MWSRTKRASVVIALLAAAQLAAWLGYDAIEQRRHSRDAPKLDYTAVTNQRVSRAVLAKPDGTVARLPTREPALVHFWASWCRPCRTELPSLLALERPRVYAISVDEDWSQVREFFPGPVPAKVYLDPHRAVAGSFGVSTLPDTYLVRGDEIVGRLQGPQDWSSRDVHALLRRVLGVK